MFCGKSNERNDQFEKKFPSNYSIIKKFINSHQPVVFDIGSHQGETIEEMLKHFNSPIIHAFEPDQDNFKKITDTYSSNKNVFINNQGVGSVNESEIFYVNKISHTNSFLRVNDSSKDHV